MFEVSFNSVTGPTLRSVIASTDHINSNKKIRSVGGKTPNNTYIWNKNLTAVSMTFKVRGFTDGRPWKWAGWF